MIMCAQVAMFATDEDVNIMFNNLLSAGHHISMFCQELKEPYIFKKISHTNVMDRIVGSVYFAPSRFDDFILMAKEMRDIYYVEQFLIQIKNGYSIDHTDDNIIHCYQGRIYRRSCYLENMNLYQLPDDIVKLYSKVKSYLIRHSNKYLLIKGVYLYVLDNANQLLMKYVKDKENTGIVDGYDFSIQLYNTVNNVKSR